MSKSSSRRAAIGVAAGCASLAAFLVLAQAPARAERADRDKPAEVTADHSTLDDLHQVAVLTGHVLLVKGTMRLTGDRMERRQDERGYQHYVVTAAGGELATFHERRDPVQVGVESTIDGVGERIDYDDQTDQVILTRRALVKKFDNGEQREVLSGERIVYDGRKDSYEVDGRNAAGGGPKVHLVIPPRSTAPAPSSGPSLQADRPAPEARP